MAPWFDSTLGMHQRKDEQNLLFVSPTSLQSLVEILFLFSIETKMTRTEKEVQKEAEEKGADQ